MKPIQLHTLLSQAVELVDDDKPLHAAQLLQRVVASHPECEKAYSLLVDIYVQWGRHNAVENLLLRGLRANPGSAELLRLLGLHYMRQGEHQNALACLLKIRHLQDVGLHQTLGLLYARMGKHEEAVQELKLTAQLDPKLPGVFELWGKELLVLKKTDDAIAVLKRAILIEPYSSLAHRLLGDAYMLKNQWQRAYDQYVLAADMDPDDTEAWLGIAYSLVSTGRLEEARRYCEHVLRVNPRDVEASVLRLRISVKMNEQAQAIPHPESSSSSTGRKQA